MILEVLGESAPDWHNVVSKYVVVVDSKEEKIEQQVRGLKYTMEFRVII